MARARTHGIADHYQSQSPNRISMLPQVVHLGNLFVERASIQRNIQGIFRDTAVSIKNPFRAGILVALVAKNAVVNFAQDLACRHAAIREGKAIAATKTFIRANHRLGKAGNRASHTAPD